MFFKIWIETLLNCLHNEIFDISIAVFAWKGTWDVVDIGIKNIIKYFSNAQDLNTKSLIAACVIGYSLYFALISIDHYLAERYKKFGKRLKKFTEDFLIIVAYFSMVAVWFTIWSSYDLIVAEKPNKDLINMVIHFTVIILFCSMGITSALFGPVGSEDDCEDYEFVSVQSFNTDQEFAIYDEDLNENRTNTLNKRLFTIKFLND